MGVRCLKVAARAGRACGTTVHMGLIWRQEVENRVESYVVALRAKNGEYSLYVEAFADRIVDEGDGLKEKSYLKHTTRLDEAKRYSLRDAEDVLRKIEEFRCKGRVEPLWTDGSLSTLLID